MILAMGVGSWVGGLFHLITHAFFKALLFLGSGSVIHAAHHEQELPQYGGLIRKIPITGVTFLIAVFAIAGFGIAGWGFSGFYSKDLILQHAAAFGYLGDESSRGARGNLYWLLFILPAVIAYVTPFYMMRCWTLTFWGKPRNQHLYDHAHESPILWVPLAVLALASIIGGRYMNVREFIEYGRHEIDQYTQTQPFRTAWPTEPSKAAEEHESRVLTSGGAGSGEGVERGDVHGAAASHAPAGSHADELLEHGEHTMHKALAGGWAWLIGMGAGFLLYMNGYAVANVLMKIPPLRWIHTWLYRRMYFDELYWYVFVNLTMALSWLSAAFDRYVVDGIVNFAGWATKKTSDAVGLHDQFVVDGAVNGIASVAQDLGAAVRAPQTGRIRMYVTILMIAVTLGLAGAIVVVLSR
jgi:NADH-quinone oxidoreductase subunit L